MLIIRRISFDYLKDVYRNLAGTIYGWWSANIDPSLLAFLWRYRNNVRQNTANVWKLDTKLWLQVIAHGNWSVIGKWSIEGLSFFSEWQHCKSTSIQVISMFKIYSKYLTVMHGNRIMTILKRQIWNWLVAVITSVDFISYHLCRVLYLQNQSPFIERLRSHLSTPKRCWHCVFNCFRFQKRLKCLRSRLITCPFWTRDENSTISWFLKGNQISIHETRAKVVLAHSVEKWK